MTDPLLPKITELKETRYRTVTKKDALGNRTRVKEQYTAFRDVKTVSAGQRFAHLIIDSIAFQIIVSIIQFSFSMGVLAMSNSTVLSATLQLVLQIISLLIYPAMYFVCESAWQKTPAKFLTKSIVIDEYGEKPDARTIALRSLVRIVPFEAFSFLGGGRGWHDRWSNTWVVSMEERDLLKSLQTVQSMS